MSSEKYTDICKACGRCNGSLCAALLDKGHQTEAIQTPLEQSYSGLRFSSDAFDCAIPISMDQHSGCSYNCLYCFSNNLSRGIDRGSAGKGEAAEKAGTMYREWPLKRLRSFLEDDLVAKPISVKIVDFGNLMARAAQKMIRAGSPMQWGGLGDPFDEIERASGWALQAIPLFQKHKVPVRISSKGAEVLMTEPYIKAFDGGGRHFWFAFSCITANDGLIERIDLAAPNATRRLAAMKMYSDMGFKCSLRMRPFIPYVSDCWSGEPEGWRILLEKAAVAGAKAVSFEWVFLCSAPTPRQQAMYRLWFRESGHPEFGEWYNEMSDTKQACRRANRGYKYDLTMKIREKTHELGMVWSSSDPHFKEYGDSGCCCGILPDDPVFGKWSRKQMTNIVVEGRQASLRGEQRYYTWKDVAPEWAEEVMLSDMVNLANHHDKDGGRTFGEHLRNKWNNPHHSRGPWRYFGGVLRPCGKEKNNDVIYKYEDWLPGAEKPRPIITTKLLTSLPERKER